MKQALKFEVMELQDELKSHKKEYEQTREVILNVLEDIIDSVVLVLESETPLSRRENIQNLADLGGFELKVRSLTDKQKANIVRDRYEPKMLRHYNDKMLADMYDYEFNNPVEHGKLAYRKGLSNA